MESTVYDVIIIGSGPGGMTAALYAARANLKVMLLEKGAPGGKMLTTAEIENWPGIIQVSGMQLAMDMYKQATEIGAQYAMGDVVDVVVNGEFRDVVLSDGTIHKTKTVIIATGTKERLLPAKGLVEAIGRGVSFCATCDGAFFKGKDVVVVGGGNSAIEESYHLSKLVNKITILVRKDHLRAEKILQTKLENCNNVEIKYHTELHEVCTDNGKVSGVQVLNNETQEITNLEAQGVFIYVGADPVSNMVTNLGILDEVGNIITDENMVTSVKGVYAIGDVRKKYLRQIVTATNDGAIAAQHLQAYLAKFE